MPGQIIEAAVFPDDPELAAEHVPRSPVRITHQLSHLAVSDRFHIAGAPQGAFHEGYEDHPDSLSLYIKSVALIVASDFGDVIHVRAFLLMLIINDQYVQICTIRARLPLPFISTARSSRPPPRRRAWISLCICSPIWPSAPRAVGQERPIVAPYSPLR
jgi:hypothetical protein